MLERPFDGMSALAGLAMAASMRPEVAREWAEPQARREAVGEHTDQRAKQR